MKAVWWECGYWSLASLVLLAVGSLFHSILVPRFAPNLQTEYQNRAIFRDLRGWTGSYMLIHPLVYGLLFAAAFRLVGGMAWADTLPHGLWFGAVFGLALFVVGCLPVYLLNYASFAISRSLILSWILHGLCQYALAGMALGAYCGAAR